MNILINCSIIKVGGGIQVANSFLTEISQNKEHNFVIVLSSVLEKQIDKSIFASNHKFIKYDINAGIKTAFFNKNSFLDKLVSDNKIDRVFTVFGPSYWKPKVKHVCGFAKPQYIYRESPFFKKISLKENLKINAKRFSHLYSFRSTTDVFITELWDVSNKLQELFPKKEINTVTNTFNQVFDDKSLWNNNIILPTFDGVTLLTISANYTHKNLDIIPKVILYLKIHYPQFKFRFVLTLNKEDILIEDSSVHEHIVFLGRVDINQCPFLYKQSDFMFLPTLLECFSASYPEAMKMNVPILTSDLPFAKSICGKAAAFFDPIDISSVSNAIYSLSLNLEHQQELIRLGNEQLNKFDTSKSRAEKYLKIIKK